MKKKDFKSVKKLIKGIYSEIARLDGEVYGINLKLNMRPVEENITSDEPKQTKLELQPGKWYKSTAVDKIITENKAVFYITDIDEKGDVSAYGFNYKGIWYNNTPDFTNVNRIQDKWKIATNEEVESALIEEAKKRGLVEGAKVKCLQHGWYIDLKGKLEWNGHALVYVSDEITVLFIDGQWATIVEEPKHEIDWNKTGQLVFNKNDSTIVFVMDNENENMFSGTIITEHETKGDYGLFVKNEFKLYKGSITLKND